MKLSTMLVASAIGCSFALSANADVITFTGNTTGGPTFDRGDGSGTDAVSYQTYTFIASSSGTYSFTTAASFDSYSFLYSGVGGPSGSLLASNNSLASIGTSGFAVDLVAGMSYSFVNASFLNTESGFFSSTIDSPGTIVPLSSPTPATAVPNVRTFTGDTTGGPTYNRVDDPIDTGAYANQGNGVSYNALTFQVGAVGAYSFIASTAYDSFLTLYAGFDPLNPSAGVLGTSDDAYNGDTTLPRVSAFSEDLTPGVNYTLVTSGFDSDEAGFFSDAIVGPGAISAVVAVPEPDLIALMLAGFGLVGFTSRRRKIEN